MTTERLISAPPKARLLAIPQEYMAICQREYRHTIGRGERKGEVIVSSRTDSAAAALLFFFERWLIWRIKDSQNKISWRDVWLFFSVHQLQDYEFGGMFGVYQIEQALDLLISLGFVTRRRNPDNRWDRTYQYQFQKENVQQAINNLPPFLDIEEWKGQYSSIDSAKSVDRFGNIDEAIPHDPPQNPEHDPVVVVPPAKNGKTAAAEIETEPETTPLQLAYTAYEKNIGIISQVVGEQIGAAVDDYPSGWVEDAIKEAALSNVRSWKYIAAILQRWAKDGRAPKNGKTPPPTPPEPRRAADPHCPVCGGNGAVVPDVPRGHALYGKSIPCPACVGVEAVIHAR
jgi:DnaD/phage-associated family protein